jgi:hypothetical protein
MDWLTQLLSGLGPSAANAAPLADTFDQRFAGAPMTPTVAAQAQPVPLPPPAPMNVPPAAAQAPSLGESISGGSGGPGGQPLDISTQGPGSPGPAGTPGFGQKLGSLAQGLRGVTAPAAPVAQRVATPHAPVARPIGSGNELVSLLMSLGIGPKDIVPGFRLPGGRM